MYSSWPYVASPTWSSTEQVARPATKRFHPSDWRPLETCCRPWTWWCNDATALAGYATTTMMTTSIWLQCGRSVRELHFSFVQSVCCEQALAGTCLQLISWPSEWHARRRASVNRVETNSLGAALTNLIKIRSAPPTLINSTHQRNDTAAEDRIRHCGVAETRQRSTTCRHTTSCQSLYVYFRLCYFTPLDDYTALQLSFHYGFILFHWRRLGPLATSDNLFLASSF